MTLHNKTKINQLLQNWPQGAVATTHWLEEQGISRQLRLHYLKSKWIETVGDSAFKRAGDTIDWKGGLYAIQKQLKLSIHVGGLTAIVLQGAGHYLRFEETVQLFGDGNTKSPLPVWFRNYKWGSEVQFCRTKFLPYWLDCKEIESKNFSITVSTLERAILECIYISPAKMDLVECYQIMEGLTTLRPNILQELLERCESIKVKRLFLYMAEKANHAWFKHIKTSNIDLGSGKRSIVKNGFYDAKYKITLPKELESL
ncbi:type IV toxin-antitoxin system AbiEi family antitoxin [Rickettsiales bacterium]|nr:type IV toxin-antitoxin system AbiEi family antitoxin [Rickettsiales bacterium]